MLYYFLQTMVFSALMYGIYYVLLRNRPYVWLARIYLLLSAVLPLILPLISLPVAVRSSSFFPAIVLPAVTIGTGAAPGAGWSARYWLLFIYILVAVVLLVRALLQLMAIYRILHKHAVQELGNTAVVYNTSIGPASFGKYIFLPGGEADSLILAHEQAHVALRHTVDIVLMTVLQALAWPNLVLRVIRKELEAVHEFQADQLPGADRQQYAALIVAAAFGASRMPLTHSFIIHPIKRRIMMLQKNKKGSSLRPVLQVSAALLLLFPAMLAVQSCKENTPAPAAARVYEKVDQMPEFEGGQDAMMSYLASHIKYPDAAREQNKEGRVLVKFVVNDKGAVVQPEVLRSPDPYLSAAALEVIRTMPAWKPGMKNGHPVSVFFTLPITFRLES